MAAPHLVRIFARIDYLVAKRPVEDVALGLCMYPFLAVGWGDLVEFGAVEGYRGVLVVIEDDVVNGGAEIL